MNPCFLRCIDCVYSIESNKRLKCTEGMFDVKTVDGILLVPFDSDCMLFERKRENDNIVSEGLYEKQEKK